MINNTTGSKIKELRNKLNLTQQQLADMVGVSNKAVSKWESGDGLPDIENLKRVSRIFNVSIDELLSNEIKKENDSELNKVLIIIAGLTVLLYFLPFMKMNPFDNSEFTFISLSGIKLLMESFINFKLGNILIGVSLILILVNAYFQVYDFYKNQINSKQRVFSLISLVSSFIIWLY